MKKIARLALSKAGFEITRIRPPLPDPEIAYVKGGRIPWTPGYDQAKTKFIVGVLSDPALLERFHSATRLPTQFGVGLDERCVEYPWLVSHLSAAPESMLDAGSTLNHAFILNHPVLQRKKLHILTLAPEDNCFWHMGISYLYNDLRNVPIRDGHYDIIACISTLEHVGCDNSLLTRHAKDREDRSEDFLLVMRELRRVLKPGGTLFLTVPFGVYRHFGTFQQFDLKFLTRALDTFGSATDECQTFYRYTHDGWNVASAADCGESEYVEWIMRPPDQRPKAFPVEPDLAAAARAVACVRLIKR